MTDASSPSGASPWKHDFVTAPDGTRLYVRSRAASQALTAVLCDGIACDGFIWRFLQDDLVPIANVLHWNYRGHGRSAAPAQANRIDMASLVADLDAVRAERVEGATVLFGHSMGCQVALEGYRSCPDHIRALVLICGAAGRITYTFKGSKALAQALPPLIERARKHPQLIRALWSHVPPELATRIAIAAGEVDAKAIEPADIVRYSEHVANMDPLMFLQMLKLIGDSSAEDLLPNIRVPVLVIAGEQDSFTPTHLAEKMAALIPDSELVIVPGATHVVPIERREQIRERIFDFLERRVLQR